MEKELITLKISSFYDFTALLKTISSHYRKNDFIKIRFVSQWYDLLEVETLDKQYLFNFEAMDYLDVMCIRETLYKHYDRSKTALS